MKGGDVKASTLIKIARAFGVSTDTVLGIDKPEHEEQKKTKSLGANSRMDKF
jgi:hypothetical protein